MTRSKESASGIPLGVRGIVFRMPSWEPSRVDSSDGVGLDGGTYPGRR